MFPSISPSRYRSSLPVSSPRICTDLPMWPTSALRCGSATFGVSLCGAGVEGDGVVAGASGGTGCAGWVGFMLIGLLSSGRAFHISAPFSLVSLSSDQIKLTYDTERLSQINLDLPVSVLLSSQMK